MKIKRIWLYDNKRGHKWWSDVPNPEDKENAIKALISTPVLEHMDELRKQFRNVMRIVGAQECLLKAYRIGGKVPESALDILENKIDIMLKAENLLTEIRKEERKEEK